MQILSIKQPRIIQAAKLLQLRAFLEFMVSTRKRLYTLQSFLHSVSLSHSPVFNSPLSFLESPTRFSYTAKIATDPNATTTFRLQVAGTRYV